MSSEDNDRDFSEIEFPGNQSGNDYFNSSHEPTLLYNYLEHMSDELDGGSISTDDDSDVASYAKIDYLRGTMQYIEEFGIFLSSYLREEGNIVDDLISTNISSFYESCNEESEPQYLRDHNVDSSYEERLRVVLNYDYSEEENLAETLEPLEGYEELTDKDIREKFETSLEIIKDRIRVIAEFYIEFRDLYNAIKHGNRVVFEGEFEVSGDQYLTESLLISQPYVTALCKTSTDIGGGKPYLLNYPLNRIISRSNYILTETHTLFEYIRDISRARTEDRERIPCKTFSRSSDDRDRQQNQNWSQTDSVKATTSDDYIEIWNNEMKTVLPKTDDFADSFSVPTPKFAARLMLKDNQLHVQTELDQERSRDYPVIITYTPEAVPGARLSLKSQFNMNFRVDYMDFKQYVDFHYLSNNSSVSKITFEFLNDGIEFTDRCDPDSFEFDEIQDGIDIEIAESVAKLQKITNRYVPVPRMILEEQADIIHDNIDEVDTRQDAQNILREVTEFGDDITRTHVFVRIADEDRHAITFHESLAPTFTAPDGRSFSVDELDTNGKFSIKLRNIEGEPQSILNHILDNEDTIIDIFEMGVPYDQDSEESFTMVLDHHLHKQQFWYDESEVVIRAK